MKALHKSLRPDSVKLVAALRYPAILSALPATKPIIKKKEMASN